MQIREVDFNEPKVLAVPPPGSRLWVIWLAIVVTVTTLIALFAVNLVKGNKVQENKMSVNEGLASEDAGAQKVFNVRANLDRQEAPHGGLLERAATALVEGDRGRAQLLLRAAEIEWQRLMGILEYQKGEFNSALQKFQITAGSEMSEVSDFINMASTLAALGKKDEALEVFREARMKNLDDDYAANRYFLALLEYGKSEQAEEEIAAALQSSPTQSLSQIALAASVIELRKGRKGKALDFYLAARSLLPNEVFNGLKSEAVLDEVRVLIKTD